MLPLSKRSPSVRAEDYMIVVFGPPGVGKTTFASQFDRPLFFSTDRGTRFLECYSIDVHSWKAFLLVISELEKNKKKMTRYGCFVIDHVDDLFRMCQDYVCKKLNIQHPGDEEWGKGWDALRSEFRRAIARLLNLQHGIIFIAHEEWRTIETKVSKYDKLMPAIPKSGRRVLLPLVDVIVHAFFKRVRKKGGGYEMKRFITTSPSEEVEVKDRTGRCPSGIMELNGQRFLNAFRKGGSHEAEQTSKKGRRAKQAE